MLFFNLANLTLGPATFRSWESSTGFTTTPLKNKPYNLESFAMHCIGEIINQAK